MDLAQVDREAFCPFHGGFVLLASCPIIATSARYQVNSQLDDPGDEADPVVSFTDTTGEVDEVAPRRVAAGTSPFATAPRSFRSGSMLESTIDGTKRLVLADAPGVPEPERGGLFRRRDPQYLPSVADLTNHGATAARPARCCPVCLHPLPITIDIRDPYPVALVGSTQASKTTTMIALIDSAAQEGPAALGVSTFSTTEASYNYLQSLESKGEDIFEKFREGKRVGRTAARVRHPPLEFRTTFKRGENVSVLIQDVAGENLTDPDDRLHESPTVLWSDAVIFIYNPEDSPLLRSSSTSRFDQAIMLNGLRDDLEARGPSDPTGRRYPEPPLVFVLAKADLLPTPPDLRSGQPQPDEIRSILRALRDGSVVSAAERWPDVHWGCIAAAPANGGEQQGVLEVFRLVLDLLARQ